ncbi:hypothetical protein D3C80_517040 [compost metagenome]
MVDGVGERGKRPLNRKRLNIAPKQVLEIAILVEQRFQKLGRDAETVTLNLHEDRKRIGPRIEHDCRRRHPVAAKNADLGMLPLR